MTLYVKGSWKGWDGDTNLQLTDGSVWRQDECLYEYRYAYWPKAELKGSKLQVEGMSRAVRARCVRGATLGDKTPDRVVRQVSGLSAHRRICRDLDRSSGRISV